MFYRPADGHGLPHNPFNAIVTPRPIGWISTRGSHGDNLAPYSFFNAVAYAPPQVMFASTGDKDSLKNIRETGVFAVNIVGLAMLDAMNATSATLPRGTDEFTRSATLKAECHSIPCPFVAQAPAVLECQMTQIIPLKGQNNFLILAEVTGVHISDACLVDGVYDPTRAQHLARLGHTNYTVLRDQFALDRPAGA